MPGFWDSDPLGEHLEEAGITAGNRVILPGLFGTLCSDPNGMLMVFPADVHVPVSFICAAWEALLWGGFHAAASRFLSVPFESLQGSLWPPL